MLPKSKQMSSKYSIINFLGCKSFTDNTCDLESEGIRNPSNPRNYIRISGDGTLTSVFSPLFGYRKRLGWVNRCSILTEETDIH